MFFSTHCSFKCVLFYDSRYKTAQLIRFSLFLAPEEDRSETKKDPQTEKPKPPPASGTVMVLCLV